MTSGYYVLLLVGHDAGGEGDHEIHKRAADPEHHMADDNSTDHGHHDLYGLHGAHGYVFQVRTIMEVNWKQTSLISERPLLSNCIVQESQ